MKLIRLTALSSFVLASALFFTSCEKAAEEKKTTDYEKKNIPLTSAQENNPANTSSALGSLDVFYTKETRTLTWTVTWSGLTGPVAAMHIHGLAPKGYNAGIVQNIITASGGITNTWLNPPTNTIPAFLATGKFSGTTHVDGSVIKELDLLNGNYYINIHTATYPGGEIRAQIEFQ